eukprot:GILJ01011007.1.p1 GENE.GILJ01011007.1~~GILJ01011007.1.p1  ORF type:complete len:217 (+),score=13.23 GILJ01011007.1:49-699(+)
MAKSSHPYAALEECMVHLGQSFTQLEYNMHKLSAINDNLVQLNGSVDHFLTSFALHSSTQDYFQPSVSMPNAPITAPVSIPEPTPSCLQSNIPRPSLNAKSSIPQKRNAFPSKIPVPSSSTQNVKKMIPALDADHKMPARYNNPVHRDKLERVLEYIYTVNDGCALPDIVSYCGVSTLNCNEYLNTLVRQGVITRVKEHKGKGFVYKPMSSSGMEF